MRQTISMFQLAVLLLGCSAADNVGPPPPPPPGGGGDPSPASVSAVEITNVPDTMTSLGLAVQLGFVARDSAGNPLEDRRVTWSARNPSVASVNFAGEIRSRGNGTTWVVLAVEGVTDSASITVRQRPVTLTLGFRSDTVFTPGIPVRTDVAASDSLGKTVPIEDLQLSWTSSDPSIVNATPDGRVIPIGGGTASVEVTTESVTASAALTVIPEVALEVDTGVAANLQQIIEDTLAAHGLRGLAASVSIPGSGMWTGVAGVSGPGRALRPGMLFAVASVTKTMTGALIMALAEEGVLSLDDSIGAFLPPFDNVDPAITVRQLLLHSSGLFKYNSNPAYGPTLLSDMNRVWRPDEILQTFVDVPDFAPGAGIAYSNTNYLILGMIAEAVTGKELNVEFADRFWTPLGIDNILLPPYDSLNGVLSQGWFGSLDVTTPANLGPAIFSGRWAAYGAVATVGDITRWGNALFAGDVVSSSSLSQMTDWVAVNGGGALNGTGLALRRYGIGGLTLWGHPGRVGGFSSVMMHDPASGITATVIINEDGSNHPAVDFTIVPALIGAAGG